MDSLDWRVEFGTAQENNVHNEARACEAVLRNRVFTSSPVNGLAMLDRFAIQYSRWKDLYDTDYQADAGEAAKANASLDNHCAFIIRLLDAFLYAGAYTNIPIDDAMADDDGNPNQVIPLNRTPKYISYLYMVRLQTPLEAALIRNLAYSQKVIMNRKSTFTFLVYLCAYARQRILANDGDPVYARVFYYLIVRILPHLAIRMVDMTPAAFARHHLYTLVLATILPEAATEGGNWVDALLSTVIDKMSVIVDAYNAWPNVIPTTLPAMQPLYPSRVIVKRGQLADEVVHQVPMPPGDWTMNTHTHLISYALSPWISMFHLPPCITAWTERVSPGITQEAVWSRTRFILHARAVDALARPWSVGASPVLPVSYGDSTTSGLYLKNYFRHVWACSRLLAQKRSVVRETMSRLFLHDLDALLFAQVYTISIGAADSRSDGLMSNGLIGNAFEAHMDLNCDMPCHTRAYAPIPRMRSDVIKMSVSTATVCNLSEPMSFDPALRPILGDNRSELIPAGLVAFFMARIREAHEAPSVANEPLYMTREFLMGSSGFGSQWSELVYCVRGRAALGLISILLRVTHLVKLLKSDVLKETWGFENREYLDVNAWKPVWDRLTANAQDVTAANDSVYFHGVELLTPVALSSDVAPLSLASSS